jgi:hypothetical protein
MPDFLVNLLVAAASLLTILSLLGVNLRVWGLEGAVDASEPFSINLRRDKRLDTPFLASREMLHRHSQVLGPTHSLGPRNLFDS